MKLPHSNPLNPPFQLNGRGDFYRFHEEPEAHFRFVGLAHELAKCIRHQGWYVEDEPFQDETTVGVVYRLPSGRGFIAGCTDPWNREKDGRGPCLLEIEAIAEEREAALRADRIAEIYAEHCREDNRKELARIQAEEQAEEERENREVELALSEVCAVE